MKVISQNGRGLEAENAVLRARLEEAEDTLNAIRSGKVEALVIGDQIFMLESAETASNRFRGRVLEEINDIVVAVDPETRVTYLNPAAETKYGVRAGDILGREIRELFRIRWLDRRDEAEFSKQVKTNGF